MRIEIRNDSVLLDGYVNAVARDSRPIPSIKGKFIEQIEPRAFQNALDRTDNVDLLLNHDENKKLGSTSEGNLQLFEDNIGLRAICTVKDADVIEKAKNNQLRGWSFGFYANKDKWEDTTEGIQRRCVQDLDLFEVSIIDNTMLPAYTATSIEMRDNKEVVAEKRSNDFKAVIVDESVKETKKDEKKEDEKRVIEIDYSIYEKQIEMLKLKPYL